MLEEVTLTILLGMSSTGEWDPDGYGIRRAPAEIAKKIWSKARKVHGAQVILPLLATAAFYASPL